MDEISEAVAATKFVAEKNTQTFKEAFERDVARWVLTSRDAKFLQLTTTARISERALLSNFHVHLAAQNALAEALAREFTKFPRRQYLFITIACDVGLTWESEPIINTGSLRNIFNQHLRRCGLHGFVLIEFDIWKRLPGDPGRRVVPHAHCVCWGEDGAWVNVAALQSDLCGRAALKNSLGARPVVVEEINATSADFARIGSYMLKRPAYAKLRLPNLKGEGFHLEGRCHCRGSVARLVEIFSQLEVKDVVFSIGAGSGRSIAQAVRRAAAEEVRDRPGVKAAPTRKAVKKAWTGIRAANTRQKFKPCQIVTR